MARRDPASLRWIVETGDLVYWRDDVGSRDYTPARVALITASTVYFTAGPYDYRQPMGITEGTEVWQERREVARRRAAPREGFARMNGKLYFDWSIPPEFEPTHATYRRKAS